MASSIVEKPHVVAVPFPMQGHINPMLALCQRLASSSCIVTFVNTSRNHERLLGSTSAVPKVQGNITFVAVSDGLDPEAFAGGPNESLNASLVASDGIEKPFEKLVECLVAQAGRISCILSDGYLGWSQDVASRFGIPRVALWTSNVAYNLVNYHLPILIQNGYAARKEHHEFDESHLVTCVPGLDPLHPRDLPSVLQSDSVNDPGFKKRITRIRKLEQASWVLVNSYQEIEQEGLRAMQDILGPKYITVGPFLGAEQLERRSSMWNEDSSCLEWLGRQSPGSVLYISFGSVANLSQVQMEHLAAGVEASKQPFLWALRPNMVPKECRNFHAEFVERTRKQGLVVDWAPQLEVLQHEAVGGHLSHCGWNSLLESIFMGVPVLGWPCVAEQTMNGKRVALDWKVGLRFRQDLAGGLVSSVEVETVIRKLFDEGDDMRRRAKELSTMARKAVKPGGSSNVNLEKFVQAIVSGNL